MKRIFDSFRIDVSHGVRSRVVNWPRWCKVVLVEAPEKAERQVEEADVYIPSAEYATQ